MYTISQSRRFKRSFRKLQHSGMLTEAVTANFKLIIKSLQNDEPLSARHRDHALGGDMFGYRECHIKGDLLLVYQKDDALLFIDLVDIGSHSQIFG